MNTYAIHNSETGLLVGNSSDSNRIFTFPTERAAMKFILAHLDGLAIYMPRKVTA